MSWLSIVIFTYLQYNETPLHEASSCGHEVVVDMLLKAGANPSAVNQVCISQENDQIMIMVQSIMDSFVKCNRSCSVSFVASLTLYRLLTSFGVKMAARIFLTNCL